MNTKLPSKNIFKSATTPLTDDLITVKGFLKIINNQINAAHKVPKDKVISKSLRIKVCKQLDGILSERVCLGNSIDIRIGKMICYLHVDNNRFELRLPLHDEYLLNNKLNTVW